ncbi:MAG: AAC(3)-I family aminoglycoside N-acetyltransferase [Dehalococcoidia bacterium]
MRDDWIVRTLGATDLAPLRELLQVFGRAFEDPDRYTGNPPPDAYLARLLGSDSFVAIAAIAGGAVVGGLTGYVLPKPEQACAELYLYDLAVDERHRRQGIATALIAELRRVAAARGIDVIFVQADLGDDPAINLYTKLGMREDVLHFDILPSAEGR